MPRFYVRRDGERIREGDQSHFKIYVPQWYDPYWFIMGSVPEKMVMAEFVRRGIYFEHIPQTNTLGGMVDPSWEPDFLLPQYKIWVEVNGLYFHTKPGAIEADALRYVKIEAAGWKVLVWWDYDILARLTELMNAVPELYFVDPTKQPGNLPKTLNLPFYTGGTTVDHLAGLRKALAGRRKPVAFTRRYRVPGVRAPK